MRRVTLILLAGLLVTIPFLAQQPDAAKPDVTPTIRANTRMVVVDAIITDASGKPVTDLKPEEIKVEENGKEQKLVGAELVNPGAEPPEALPETIYSNRPEVNAPKGTYTILLIDALNTPFDNMAFGRQQLLKYAATQLRPGQRIAVYALGTQLFRLQSFTDDPQLLAQAITNSEKLALTSAQPSPTGARGTIPGNNTLTGSPNSNVSTAMLSRLSAFQ